MNDYGQFVDIESYFQNVDDYNDSSFDEFDTYNVPISIIPITIGFIVNCIRKVISI